ncbi:DUF4163 domain-containing protein [Bacillus sp. sid0103]|uniref:PdaC/SigV domain-containing protein n=1 Tax=Bacillus sp. sid0103 TaxID=2856337 RepID=UPI001C458B3D|nr:DUF4163 domain-containing protein [Bacillus sp. sid0103]MBV7508911.1 DUF4163 domain-containing protein [Bacillus sp. sid0103]
MKKRSSFWGMISAFLLVMVFSFSSFAPSIDANASSQKAKFTKHSYKGINLLRYPQVYGINKKAASQINSTLKKAAAKSYKSYLNVKKEEKKVPREELCKKTARCKYSFNSLYEVKYNSNGKLSIYYLEYTYKGGAHGKSHVTMYNFDLSTGKQYKINNLLKTSSKYKKVQKYAFKYLSTHEPYSRSISQLSDVTVNKNTQFSFAKDGIYLVFQENEIPSYPDGNPFIKIPKSVYK